MSKKEFALNDVVEMKKGHPCGENKWKIIRVGMDIRIKCLVVIEVLCCQGKNLKEN